MIISVEHLSKSYKIYKKEPGFLGSVKSLFHRKYEKVMGDLSRILEAESFLKIPVRKLSLGQRMKMELMAALIHSPKVLFLDEPTIGLDVVMQKNLREFIREYNKKFHSTIILTSHYMEDVRQLCK